MIASVVALRRSAVSRRFASSSSLLRRVQLHYPSYCKNTTSARYYSLLVHYAAPSLRSTTQRLKPGSSSSIASSFSSSSIVGGFHLQKDFVAKFSRYFRILRIPVIAAGIYSLGYHQGVIESHRNPHKFQEQLFDSVVIDCTGASDRKDVQVEILSEHDSDDGGKALVSRNHQVAAVAKKVIDQGKRYVDQELQYAKARALTKANSSPNSDNGSVEVMTDDNIQQQVYSKDRDVQFWQDARSRLHGDDMNTEPWRFVFVEEDHPNAFVSELLPKRIFITTGLFGYSKSIDEVAFILGHEVSHSILGHCSKGNDIEMGLKTTEIILLSLDPTAGLVSFAVIAALDMLRRFVGLSFSREHEREADMLGLRLVAMCGCFDLQAGASFMNRLTLSEERGLVPPWTRTHPPSKERAREIYRNSQQFAVGQEQMEK